MLTFKDVLKLFFPFGWGILSLISVIVYLVVPDEPRWIASSAWLVSMIISILIFVHLWKYHRNISHKYNILPESNQQYVYYKICVSVLVCLATFIVSIYFWTSGVPGQYAGILYLYHASVYN